MITTNELRWFYRGTLPTEIADWLAADVLGDCLTAAKEREDVYLYVPSTEYLGIKLRENQWEIKLRNAELGVMRFGDRVEGNVEKWVKWSCEDAATESAIPSDLLKKSPWVSVKKIRRQRKYEIGNDRAIKSVPVDETISQGCNLEVTQLAIENDVWWSLALEAYGEDDKLIENLEMMANWLFNNKGVLELRVDNSYAYPKWLSLVI